MPIAFNEERWEKVIASYEAWWEGRLNRPLVPLVTEGRDPGRPMPSAPLLTQATVADLSVEPEAMIDRLDYELSCCNFLGDSFPMVNFDVFGRGIMAAFLGAQVDCSTGSVWLRAEQKPIEELHFTFAPENVWLHRIEALYRAGMDRWHGDVLMGMPDLGGVLDVLAVFLSTQGLLTALYDSPEELLRLIGEIKDLWHRFHNGFSGLLSGQRGYTDGGTLLSRTRSYTFQSEVNYMLGPEMFVDFVLPELRQTCRRLPRTICRLDGVAEIRHLDKLLEIPELAGIQWIPDEGQGQPDDWLEVYRKIHAAGKLLQVAGYDALRPVMKQLGTGRGVSVRQWERFPASEEERLRRELLELGIR